MMRIHGFAGTSSALLAAAGLVVGCSFINAFDDVAPQVDAAPPGNDAAPPADSGADASDSGPVDTGTDAHDAGPTGPHGAIVVGGAVDEDGGESYVLTALDPSTGSELPNAREKMIVAAIVYDGARDLWFIFESGGIGPFPLPSDPFWVHARQLDTTLGTWKELSKTQIPAGLSFSTTAGLSQKLAYVAYGTPDGGAADGGTVVSGAYGLVILDTSDPANVSVQHVLTLNSPPQTVVGTPSSVNPVGGFASMGTSSSGHSIVTPVLVPATDPPQIEAQITGAPMGGSAGSTAITNNGTPNVAVVTRPFGAPTVRATVSLFDPAASDPTLALVAGGTFPFLDGNVKAPAFSKCSQTLFVLGTNADLNLYAVSLANVAAPDSDGGVPSLTYASAPTGHSGQAVYFEPFTNTVLAPFSQGNNFALTAFTLGGTPQAPTLTQRVPPRWSPPPDLRPNLIATRTPSAFSCPTAGDQ